MLNRTYRDFPYFRPPQGAIIANWQIALMGENEALDEFYDNGRAWKSTIVDEGILVDFLELDGTRADCLEVGSEYGRMLLVPAEVNDEGMLYRVEKTSY